MPHLLNAMLLVSSLFLLLGAVLGVRNLLEIRKGRSSLFRDYFGPEYDRDLLRQSAFSEAEDWQADRHVRFAPLRLREPEANEPKTRDNDASQWGR